MQYTIFTRIEEKNTREKYRVRYIESAKVTELSLDTFREFIFVDVYRVADLSK